MASNRIQPAAWLTVLLAAIPGLLVVLSRRTAPQLGVLLAIFSRLYLVLLVVGGLYIWYRQRKFPAWALLPAGLLAWFAVYFAGVFLTRLLNTYDLLSPFMQGIESGIVMLQLIVAFVFFAIFLHDRRLPVSAWLVAGAIVVINILAASHYITERLPADRLPQGILQFLTVSGFGTIEGLMLVAIGLAAVRQHGLLALLVVIGGYGYMCLDSDYISGYRLNEWAGYTAYVISMTALYLLITPVAMLRARSRVGLALAVFIPMGIFHLARIAVPTFVLHGQYGIPWQSVNVLLTLVLGWVLYSHVSEVEGAERQPVSAEVMEGE